MEIRIVLTAYVSVQTPLIGLPQQATGPHESRPLTHIVGENCLAPADTGSDHSAPAMPEEESPENIK